MQSALRLLKSFPFKTSVIVGLLCFVIIEDDPSESASGKSTHRLRYGMNKKHVKEAEFYPFSSFPMYSKFSANPVYLYVTDIHDKPIASATQLGVRTSVIKKNYDEKVRVVGKREGTAISKLSQPLKQEAGMQVLRVLKEELAAEYIAKNNLGVLRLYETIIRFDDNGEISETTTLVGEL